MQYQGNGVAFQLFGIEVRWYAIFIVTGMTLALRLVEREMESRGIDGQSIYDLAIWMIPIGVAGARIWYVLFEADRFHSLWDVINIRSGGLAIQGGIMAALLTCWIFAKKKDFSFLRLTDLLFPYVALAQAIGRWGNFTNNEAHGGPTSLPWGVWIDGVSYHPTFLYESIGDLLIFLFLYWYGRKKRKVDGQSSCWYLITYGLLRFFIEGLRTDSLMWGPCRVAQLLSLFGGLIGLVGLIVLSRKSPNAQLPGKFPEKTK